jgi:hypothetical protein
MCSLVMLNILHGIIPLYSLISGNFLLDAAFNGSLE